MRDSWLNKTKYACLKQLSLKIGSTKFMQQRYSLRGIAKALKIKSLHFFGFLMLFGLLFSSGSGLFASKAHASGGSENEVIVQLEPGSDIYNINMLLGTTLVRPLSLDRTFLLAVPPGTTAADLVSNLQTNPAVTFAEPNFKMFATEAQQAFIYYDQGSSLENGTSSPEAVNIARKQWAWERIDLYKSQRYGKGNGIIVATLDTGANNHASFNNQLIAGYNAITMSSDTSDDSGHGTFVAGVLAQVAPDASIMPVKVMNSRGEGTIAFAAEGLYWASNHNARVINMSFGLYNRSKLLELTVKYAQDRGNLLIASAGNSSTAENRFPAAFPGVIGVAATDSQNHKASFSNYGDNARVSAPGVKIYSAYYTGGYAYGDGTSFAAPQVAGLAAQVWSRRPGNTADFVSNRILNNAISLVDDDPVYGAKLGKGLINNYKAIQSA